MLALPHKQPFAAFTEWRPVLAFDDPAMERRFQADDFQRWLPMTRFTIFLGLLFYAAFAYVDTFVSEGVLDQVLIIRLGMVCPFMAMLITATFTAAYERFEQLLLSFMVVIAGGAIVAFTAMIGPPGNYLYSFGIDIVIIFCAALTRIRYLYLAPLSLCLGLLTQYVLLYANPVPRGPLIAEEAFLLVSMVIATLGIYLREFYNRRSFLGQELLREEMERSHALLIDANAASRAKSEFIANMSHELRTPLNAIIGFSDLMRADRGVSMTMRKFQEYAGDIHSSGEHLLRVINNILDLSKIEAGKHVLEESVFAPHAVATIVEIVVKPRAEEKKLDFKIAIDDDVRLKGDLVALQQMLLNLLANAVKFTARGAVRLTGEWRDGEGYAFVVSDTGIGMTEAEIGVALTPFGTIGNPYTRTQQGTGLGLPIVAGLARLHGARFVVESKPGKGTEVGIIFPPERVLRVVAPGTVALTPRRATG